MRLRLPEGMRPTDPANESDIRCFGRHWRIVLLALTGAVLASGIWLASPALSTDGKTALSVLLLAMAGWASARASDAVVGLAAAAMLALTGVIEQKALFSALGHELIWLMTAAFILAAALRESGAVVSLAEAALRRASTVARLFLIVTLLIAATSFVIPSTSGRAALLVPVFVSLGERIGDVSVRRALALLFPTVILLSACGSLIGAGAHIIAADHLTRTTGSAPSPAGWALTALPFALATSLLAAWLILHLFVDRRARTASIAPALVPIGPSRLDPTPAVALATVGLWMTSGWHGLGMGLVGLIAVCVLLLPAGSGLKAKDAFRSVEFELIILLATTMILVAALTEHGVDRWLARTLLQILPSTMLASTWLVVVLAAVISLAAHLVITSRTARASVLVPGLAIPLAALGHDAELLIMVTILGTGFCQTLPTSAKPVAIFANLPHQTFSTGDLMRLSAHLFPVLLVALVGYAFVVWDN